MLERLRIQNFKSWQDTGDMAFGSLTGFFGTNSSGKSSILQFLLMLKQTVESSDRSRVLHLGDDKSYVHLGTLHDALFMHEDPGLLNFTFAWKIKNKLGIGSGFWMNEPLEFEASIKRTGDFIQLAQFCYRSGENSTQAYLAESQPRKNGLTHKLRATSNEDSTLGKELAFEPIKFYSIQNVSVHSLPDLVPATLGVLNYGSFELEELFYRTYYLGPLREFPNRTYLWGGDESEGVGNRGERAIAALLTSRMYDNIPERDDAPRYNVEEHVAHWLKELGLIYSFKVQPIAPNRKEYEVRIQRTAESASVFLTDVGFGVSQILPVLVLLFYVPEGSTVILEQPEIHLHPAVQAGLADVFIDAIKRRKLQIILESHSEHLLQRLQRRMAEEVIAPDDIKLYFTSIEEGRSKLTTLQLDQYGNISNWPEGFFGDTMGEAAAMMRAEMERKMRQQPS